ncbi:MAG: ferrous iron transport protein A [Clostridia bacterium]|nr:ferrous iron transport protein A [Clostridia bacterium]
MEEKITVKDFLSETTTLDKLSVGESGIISEVGGEKLLRHRLLDMGLTPKTRVFLKKIAPLGDPIELTLRGYELTLRKEDAAQIRIIKEQSGSQVEKEDKE